MVIGVLRVKLDAPWVHSLKEKRMIVKSIIAKTRQTFNVSAAEVDEQDTHQTIMIGIACVAGSSAHADSTLDHVLGFIERNTDAQVLDVERELR